MRPGRRAGHKCPGPANALQVSRQSLRLTRVGGPGPTVTRNLNPSVPNLNLSLNPPGRPLARSQSESRRRVTVPVITGGRRHSLNLITGMIWRQSESQVTVTPASHVAPSR
jgi:hypothetical protein